MRKRSLLPKFLALALSGAVLVPALAFAFIPPAESDRGKLAILGGFQIPDLEVQPSVELLSRGSRKALESPALQRFFAHQSDEWEVRWDKRSDRPNLIQGVGIPVLPGRGNKLALSDLKLAHEGGPRLADVEAKLRAFMDEFPELLGVSNIDLRLDEKSSVNAGQDKQLWSVEFQQFHRGVPVEGAKVFFRINNGNIVQLGTERIADVRINATPRIDRVKALAAAVQILGFRASEVEIKNPGTLKLIPALTAGERPAEKFEGATGQGYRHFLVWEVEIQRPGDTAVWQAQVNAKNGNVVSLVDRTYYAQVRGGIYPTTNTDPEVVVGFPFTNVTNGTAKVTDAGGFYTYSGGTATATLNGKYFNMADACGGISASNINATGDIDFGTSGGTDCTTPGTGGAGNTHASRTGFYHLTNINRKAAGFLPGNSWLASTVTANMNINATCNAFWDGTTVNFYRSGGGCSNTGEIAAVFLHEWGHGMDQNSGGAASDKGTGEAVGDTFAFIETKDPCIGKNFQPGVACANCNSTCTGVRDMASFAVGGSHTIAKPSTVTSDTGINCDRYSCPYNQFVFIGAYQGPMGYEGHCESYIASTANWDLSQQLISRWGTTTGWQKMDAIWYKSLTPSKSAYRVVSGGKCNPAAVVDGCASSNWYTVYLSADDDDGNLANGTPNGCRIWDAFNAHGIACGSRPVCTQ